jgi:hypothetical protein
MARVFLALVALLALGGISRPQPSSLEASYVPGGMDSDSNFIGTGVFGSKSLLGSITSIPLVDRSFNLLVSGDKLEEDAWYILGNAAHSYELVHIPEVVTTPIPAVRAATRSPFPDECNAKGLNGAIDFDGHAANKSKTSTPCLTGPYRFLPLVPIDTHNTDWIVKGVFQ